MKLHLPLLGAAVLLFAPALSAQHDSADNEVRLRASGIYGGTQWSAQLTSTETGRPAVMLFGNAGLTAFGTPKPVVLVDLNASKQFVGMIDATGTFTVSKPLPPAPFLLGQQVVGQGFVKQASGLFLATDTIMLDGEAATEATFSDDSLGLPSASTEAGADVDAVDLDRDGDLDLSLHLGDRIALLINDGLGNFTEETDLRMNAADNYGGANDSEWADVNRDGYPDLVVGGVYDDISGTAQNQLWLNDGTGSFTLSTGLPNAPAAANDVAVGDVDRDGDLDVLMSAAGNAHSPNPEKTILYLNQGGLQGGTMGEFFEDSGFEAAAWNVASRVTRALMLGDVDRDGDLDLYLVRSDTTGSTDLGPGEPNLLLINDGFGTFSDKSTTNLPSINGGEGDNSEEAVFADFNNDGYLDIFVANSAVSVPASLSGDLLLNRGAADPGVFDNAPLNFPDGVQEDLSIRTGVVAGDVDNDGDFDIVVQPHEWFDQFGGVIGHPTLFLNQAGVQGGVAGEFMRSEALFDGLGTFISADGVFFDADRDGDLDYYAVSNGGIFDQSKTEDYLVLNDLY